MAPPPNNLTHPNDVVREIFDANAAVKDQFAVHLSAELMALAETLTACFRLMPTLNDAANRAGTVRTALAAAFVFGVLDDMLTSTKLLVSGKLLAAGNLMRQVIEGIAIAALYSTDELLVVETKKGGPVVARYWEKLEAGDRRTQGHHALEQLSLNAAKLGFNADAVRRLTAAKRHYNGFSHAGKFSIAARVALGEPGIAFVGGHFDETKLDGYRAELRERIGLCEVLPAFMRHTLRRLTPDANPASA